MTESWTKQAIGRDIQALSLSAGHMSASEFLYGNFVNPVTASVSPPFMRAYAGATSQLVAALQSDGAMRITRTITDALTPQAIITAYKYRCDIPGPLGELAKQVVFRAKPVSTGTYKTCFGVTFGVNYYYNNVSGLKTLAPLTGILFDCHAHKFKCFLYNADRISGCDIWASDYENDVDFDDAYDLYESGEISNISYTVPHIFEFIITISKGSICGFRIACKIDGHLMWVTNDGNLLKDAEIDFSYGMNLFIMPGTVNQTDFIERSIDIYNLKVS